MVYRFGAFLQHCSHLQQSLVNAQQRSQWESLPHKLPSWTRLSDSKVLGRTLTKRTETRLASAGCGDSVARKLRGIFPMAAGLSSSETVTADQIRQQKGSKVGAVFFDLDDTLVLTHKADTEAHLAVMKMIAVRAPHTNQSAVLKEFLKGFKSKAWDPEHKVDVTEWRARLWGKGLEDQGVHDISLARDLQNCFDKERMQAFRWTSKVESLVKSLHLQGIKVGVITNGHPKVQRAKLKACKAEELFDIILVGGEEPNEKPHKDIFIKACNLAGCKPDEAIMVGDTLKTDIQGGINAGFLSTVWVNVHRKELPPGAAKPDHEIATFSELQQVLEQFGVHCDASV